MSPVRIERLLLSVALVLLTVAPTAFAIRAWPSHTQDRMTWSADGTIEATCHETETIGGIQGNAWTDTRAHQRVGQTFRCPGPWLEIIQFGIDKSAPGYFGFHYRDKTVRMIVSVRRDGPDGEIVAEKAFGVEDGSFEMPLHVGVPSTPDARWYAEIRPEQLNFAGDRNNVNISTYSTYADGAMLSNGRPATGELAHLADADVAMRITRRWQMSAKRSGRYVFWSAGPYERVHRKPVDTVGLMLADDPAQPVRLRCARHEKESVQFVVTPAPGASIEKAVLAIDPFVGPGGARLADEHVRIEWLRYNLHYFRGKSDDRLYPDPLAPTNVAVRPREQPDMPMNTGFWVSVYAPRGATPGRYRSTARVRINDDVELSRPIELTVFDFDLPVATHTRTGLFHFGFFTEDESLSQRAIRMLAEFRIGIDSPWFTSPLQIIRDELAFSEKAYEIVLGERMQRGLVANGKLLNELGLPVNCVTPWADTYRMTKGEDAGRAGVIRFWKTYYPILEKHGWVDQVYARTPDEFSADKLEAAREVVKLFRDIAPGVRIMVTDIDAGTDVSRYRRLIGMADIWSQSGKSTGGLDAFFQERIREGEQVWPYIHEHLLLHVEPLSPRMFFWGLEALGYHGATLWAVGPSGKFSYPWFGIVSHEQWRAGDGNLWFPGPSHEQFSTEGLWRSARLYRLLDGLEDREYFWLMNDLAAKARAADALPPALARRIDAVNAEPMKMVWGFMGFSHDQARIERIRGEIAEIIVALRRSL
ncbi:MAG: hypothetical protein CMJ18_08415 [Phycisphaeraceae bacterium]|nr:hypothetical protein [Phycisphaeraceae bacterium]